MGFRNDAYAKVWNVTIPDKNGGYCYGKISIGKRVNENEYVTYFSGMVFFSKDANWKARELGLPEKIDGNNPTYRSIKILSADTTNKFDSDHFASAIKAAGNNEELKKYINTHATVTTHTIYDFEIAEDNNYKSNKSSTAKSAAVKTNAKTSAVVEADEEEELPF